MKSQEKRNSYCKSLKILVYNNIIKASIKAKLLNKGVVAPLCVGVIDDYSF
jgi:hypothetical protein